MQKIVWELTEEEAGACFACLDVARRAEDIKVGRNAVALMGTLERAAQTAAAAAQAAQARQTPPHVNGAAAEVPVAPSPAQ